MVLENPLLDEAHVSGSHPFPIPSNTVDLLISDWAFEHVTDPAHTAGEIARVLRPGGWLCARTPNKWGYIGLGARAVPNELHVPMLGRLQPAKQAKDTFPTSYRLNTTRSLRRHFPASQFEHFSYATDSEPAYFGTSLIANRAAKAMSSLTPSRCRSVLHVFLRKRED